MRIVVQARLNSSRLPAKALLPIGGIPMAVLAAMRAGRGGANVVLATSTEPPDALIAEAARAHGVAAFRGPRDDVLQRFALVTADLGDEEIVVRLTGDNPVPDADFVTLITDYLQAGNLEIVGTRWPADGLPYGLSAEAFRVGALRKALAANPGAYDREHVTPWLWRNLRSGIFDGLARDCDAAHLRCTVDSFDDYLTARALFDGVTDPVSVSWRALVGRLSALPDAPGGLLPVRMIDGMQHGALVLGTAQLGAAYGSVTPTAAPDTETAVTLVRRAITAGITHIDTARAYSGSETRIGRALAGGWAARAHVVTKLGLLSSLPDGADPALVADAVDASVFRSCRELGLHRLDTVLLHRAQHRTAWDGAAWRRLTALRDQGVIGRLGISAQSPAEALDALTDPDVRHLQLPYNLLDHRWDTAGVPDAALARPDVVVHVRSVYLQGILAQPEPRRWPGVAGLDATTLASWMDACVAATGRSGWKDLALAYVMAQPWIHGTIVGLATVDQLDENIRLGCGPSLSPEQAAQVTRGRPSPPEQLLNPALWPRTA